MIFFVRYMYISRAEIRMSLKQKYVRKGVKKLQKELRALTIALDIAVMVLSVYQIYLHFVNRNAKSS